MRREISAQNPTQGSQPQPQDSDPSQSQTAHPSFIQRKIAKNPEFAKKLDQMRLNLSPLVQITTGYIHPAFPRTVLQFWLLTDYQLEELAHFYHQRTPSHLTGQYPCPVNWNSSLPIEDKRRKIGRFIGLRGCDSPIWLKTEEEIAEEARRANATDEEDMWRRKMSPWSGSGY